MMTSRTSLFIVIFLLSLILISVKADYAECYCTFEGKEVITQSAKFKNCMEKCGKTVGGQTICRSECEDCCQDWCSRIDEDESKEGCREACRETCEFKKMISDIIFLFYIASGIVALIMLTVNGIRMFSSSSPEGREEAKRGIWYILLALFLIMVGGMVINYLLGRITHPASEGGLKKVEGCGGRIFHARHVVSGNDIEVHVKFENNGDKTCKYIVLLHGKGEKWVTDPDRRSGVVSVGPEESKSIKFSTTTSELKGEYRVSLNLVQIPKPKEVDSWGPVSLE